jgi:hypothetical protein
MCFNVTDPNVKIADKNIVCWKEVQKTAFFWLGFYRSLYKGKLYSLINFFFCKRVKITVRGMGWEPYINEGYHSYSNSDLALPRRRMKFIIPKGTLYYQNDKACEYVSERILRSL